MTLGIVFGKWPWPFLLMWLLLPGAVFAQLPPPPDCGRWIAVTAWQGTITMTGMGQGKDADGNIYKVNESATVNIKFVVPPFSCAKSINWTSNLGAPVYSVT